VALALGLAALGWSPAVPRAHAASAAEAALVSAVNQARAQRGLPALRVRTSLARPARAQSVRIAATGRLEHEGPGGTPFWKRLVAAGYPANRPMAENLAMMPACGAEAAREAVRGWLASPPHRDLPDRRLRGVGPRREAPARGAAQVWKLFPQPQADVAFGLLMTNPAPWKPSS
jgi:hypothetical protein